MIIKALLPTKRMDIPKLKQTTLATVPWEKAFHVNRGDHITNIKDLANCVESLSPEQFRFHVNPNGPTNHFSVWIRDALANPHLANDLNLAANLTDQKHFVKTIRDHVAWLEHA
jgi:hypothetical protein